MFIKRWKYQSPDVDPAPAAPPADPPPSAPPADPPPSDPPANKWPDTWRQELAGDNEKELKQLERYQSPKDIWNKARALEQRLSSGELRSTLPKDATPEQVTQWRTENGIPEAPDKYDIKFGGDGLPEADKTVIDGFLQTAHGKNLNNDQAKGVVDWYYQEVARLTEERQAKDVEFGKQAEDALRAEWGSDYRQNINMVSALVATAPADVADLIKGGRLANGDPLMSHPKVLQWLNGMAREINPVTTLIPNAGGNQTSAIEDEIKAIEDRMRTDRKGYNEDEKMQARYRALLTAREKLSAKK